MRREQKVLFGQNSDDWERVGRARKVKTEDIEIRLVIVHEFLKA